MPPKTAQKPAAAPYQSRDASAYEGSRLKPGPRGPMATAAPTAPTTWEFSGAGPIAGKPVVGTAEDAQFLAARGLADPEDADTAYAETSGGPIAGKAFPRMSDVATKEVPLKNKPSMFLSSGKPEEVQRLVSLGVISQATADKLMAKQNANDPMQKLRSKNDGPVPKGSYFAPTSKGIAGLNGTVISDGASAVPSDGKPAPLLPNVPKAPVAPPAYATTAAPVEYDFGPYDPGVERPVGMTLGPQPPKAAPQSLASGASATPDDDYAGAIAWARKKWGF